MTLLLAVFFSLPSTQPELDRDLVPLTWRNRGEIAGLGILLAPEIVGVISTFLFSSFSYATALRRTCALFSVLFGCLIGGEKVLVQRAIGGDCDRRRV